MTSMVIESQDGSNVHLQWADGIQYKLKSPYDFSFLSRYGRVFRVFDDQDSGNIGFGIVDNDMRY